MSSPWPTVEAHRNRLLKRHDTGRIFSFEQCATCTRWFPSEREENAAAPTLCPVHGDAAKARREHGRKIGKVRHA